MKTEKILEIDYINYSPSQETQNNLMMFDIETVKSKRIQNAQILMDGLKDNSNIKLMYPTVKEGEIPLNVPILVDSIIRDRLRKYLMDRNIYCPIHWPLSVLHDKKMNRNISKLYNMEISLICDQRYEREDMEQEIEEVVNFFR